MPGILTSQGRNLSHRVSPEGDCLQLRAEVEEAHRVIAMDVVADGEEIDI